ncbi:laccase 17 [Mycena crocata]|nr:laccase 17 [Mycena crocata]
MAFKLAALVLPFFVGQAIAAGRYYDIQIDNVRVAPDEFPRDAIQGEKGDVLHLNVTNNLKNSTMRRSTSIHWHGNLQDRTASEDSPSFVNQCPIAPGRFYQYNFPLLEQTGTYWFQGHLSTQYIDGERGTLVIYDPDDPQKSMWDVDDQNTIITLADWYHTPAEALMAQFKQDGKEPVPHSCSINGVARYVGDPVVPAIVYGSSTLRAAPLSPSRSTATFNVIETDGIATEPLTVNSFLIHAGQRYSVVLRAYAPIGNYWIRAPMTGLGTSKTLDKNNVKAILCYRHAPIADPTTQSSVIVARKNGADDSSGSDKDKTTTTTATTTTPTSNSGSGSGGSGGGSGSGGGGNKAVPVEEYMLKTLINLDTAGGDAPADHVIDLQFGTAGSGTWQINNIVYEPPRLPTLLNIINGGFWDANYTKPEHTFILKADEVVELRIHGAAHGIIHPFHLHGHAFDVITSATGSVNYKKPPRRDVVAVSDGGVIIRFRADDSGPWSLHCHIDWNLEAELAVVFAEAPNSFANKDDPKSGIVTPQYLDL